MCRMSASRSIGMIAIKSFENGRNDLIRMIVVEVARMTARMMIRAIVMITIMIMICDSDQAHDHDPHPHLHHPHPVHDHDIIMRTSTTCHCLYVCQKHTNTTLVESDI